MAASLGNSQYHVFIWITCALSSLLTHSKCTYLFGTLNQTDKQVNPKLRFTASYASMCVPALNLSFSRSHLKLKQSVSCPYEGCQFESNVYSTFNAHKSRVHSGSSTTQFKGPILSNVEQLDQLNEVAEEVPLQDDNCVDESVDDMQDLEILLERNLPSLFLKMQAVLHISESAAQEVIRQINQIQMLSQPLLQNAVQKIISHHCSDVDNSIVSDIVSVVSQSNVLLKFTSAEGSLSTASRRAFYMLRVVMPVEFALDKDHSFVYVPILKTTRDMKHSILEKLAETIYKFDAYPNNERINSVALALINKHPCLKEQGSPDGCSSWKHSLKFKMGNYRTKLRKAGCVEVGVNGGKTGGRGMAAKGLKRPKRSEVNYLPEHPEGQNGESLEAVRQLLVEEMRKVNPSGTFIASKMDLTFSMQRHEIVDAETPVKTLMERWPALFTERQVFAEFNRIVTTDLQSNFYGAVDRYTPRFVTIFKSKKGTVGGKLDELMQQMNTGKEADVTAMRTLVLRGLPILLGDEASNFYNTWNACDVDGWPQVSVGVLTVIDEEEPLFPNKLYLDPVSTAVIVEGGIVLDNLQNLPQAICILFGLSYALNLKYPKGMINTFNFIQKVMLGLGQNKLPPKLQSLKNLLLS